MVHLSGYLDLSTAVLVARGKTRLIFQHEQLPGMLVKVLRPELHSHDEPAAGALARFKRRVQPYRRLGAYRSIQREVREFLIFRSRCLEDAWPIAKIYGFVETELGLALLTERMTAPGGGLAPTIETLLDEGRFQAQHRTALHQFFDALEKYHICLCDLHTGNIVYVGDDKTTGRFVAVDGLGTRTLVPLRDWFPSLNARRTRRGASQVWSRIDQQLQREASKTGAPPAACPDAAQPV